MLTIALLALALSIGNAGCSTDSVTGETSNRVSVGIPEPERTTLSGFVELYWNEPAYLLSGGIEIPLAGRTDLIVPHGGLHITVSGRYLNTGTFLVDAVVSTSGTGAQDRTKSPFASVQLRHKA